MTKRGKTTYLGRGGRVYGPFTDEEIERLRLSAEIENYTYLWDEQSSQWRNIDPAPPHPGTEDHESSHALANFGGEAICHNSKDMVAGQLENVGEGGCDLVSSDLSESPRLAVNSSLVLNVMDQTHRVAVNVRARLVESTRRAGKWVYRIRWARRPHFSTDKS